MGSVKQYLLWEISQFCEIAAEAELSKVQFFSSVRVEIILRLRSKSSTLGKVLSRFDVRMQERLRRLMPSRALQIHSVCCLNLVMVKHASRSAHLLVLTPQDAVYGHVKMLSEFATMHFNDECYLL